MSPLMEILAGPPAPPAGARGIRGEPEDIIGGLVPVVAGGAKCLEMSAQKRLDRSALLQGPFPRPPKDLVVDPDRKPCH